MFGTLKDAIRVNGVLGPPSRKAAILVKRSKTDTSQKPSLTFYLLTPLCQRYIRTLQCNEEILAPLQQMPFFLFHLCYVNPPLVTFANGIFIDLLAKKGEAVKNVETQNLQCFVY